jgi:hypothetical protein
LPFVFGRMDARAVNGTWVSAAGMLRRPPAGCGPCGEARERRMGESPFQASVRKALEG